MIPLTAGRGRLALRLSSMEEADPRLVWWVCQSGAALNLARLRVCQPLGAQSRFLGSPGLWWPHHFAGAHRRPWGSPRMVHGADARSLALPVLLSARLETRTKESMELARPLVRS